MLFLSFSEITHIKFNAFCLKNTKAMLLAWLEKELQTGCYVYFDEKTNPLYVGKSKALASRLAHHSTAKGIEKQILDWYSIGIVFSDNPHLTEKELVRTLQPRLNILQKQG
jgi:excinuclease UvrABC nuclease subunit